MQYEMFVSSIASYYTQNNLIEEEQIDAFKYGVSLTVASLISFAIAFSWGIIFHCLIEVLIFLVLFIPLRIFTGGYHAPTLLRCSLSFVFILALLTFTINYLPAVAIGPMIVIGSIILICLVYRYSPVQHSNAPIRQKDISKYRKISLVICIAEVSIIAIAPLVPGILGNYRSLLVSAMFNLIIGSVLIFMAKNSSFNSSIKMEV